MGTRPVIEAIPHCKGFPLAQTENGCRLPTVVDCTGGGGLPNRSTGELGIDATSIHDFSHPYSMSVAFVTQRTLDTIASNRRAPDTILMSTGSCAREILLECASHTDPLHDRCGNAELWTEYRESKTLGALISPEHLTGGRKDDRVSGNTSTIRARGQQATANKLQDLSPSSRSES